MSFKLHKQGAQGTMLLILWKDGGLQAYHDMHRREGAQCIRRQGLVMGWNSRISFSTQVQAKASAGRDHKNKGRRQGMIIAHHWNVYGVICIMFC